MQKSHESEVVAYLVKEKDGKQRYITNKPNHPEDANYNIQRRNAKRLTGLESIDVEWQDHLIEKELTVTTTYYQTFSIEELREVDND
ncbi:MULTISPECIES: DUF2483 family protein [Staphylococcus]|uniref:DUF2483 family protein n=1 Tax=Staphylococcus TaxID=1279 RepID=UPI000853D535|nr:DUF2483 family protein [Staphylococcus equorum]MDK9845196.1 DUF2483 family protein [Staphylococcus equorum]MDK9849117.1 DUF2483 family protein [Staphylococcus equorum]MDK9854424.1 DUF2483 family protein [Staphylococcus equorum]OEK55391.1 hypothetical protein ASS95_01135 [Staphylococcus equorum]OEK62821.1 hypothetical protein ASS99_07890 [Staphylococcus equorum]